MSIGLVVIVVIVAGVVIVALVGFPRSRGGFRGRRDFDVRSAAAADVAEVQDNDEYNPNAPGNDKDEL